MTNFEAASSVNPRPGNGSANVYDLLNQLQQQAGAPYAGMPQQQQPYYQTPLAQQRQFQQQPYFQKPSFQQFGAQGTQFQQPFQQFQQPFTQQPFQQFQQPFTQGAAQWQSPWATQWQQNPYMQSSFATQQGI